MHAAHCVLLCHVLQLVSCACWTSIEQVSLFLRPVGAALIVLLDRQAMALLVEYQILLDSHNRAWGRFIAFCMLHYTAACVTDFASVTVRSPTRRLAP